MSTGYMRIFVPRSAAGLLVMCRMVGEQTAANSPHSSDHYIRAETAAAVADCLAQLEAARADHRQATEARVVAVAAANAARKRLNHLIRDIWHETNRRVAHEGEPAALRIYYGLPLSGRFPDVRVRNMIPLARAIVHGDANAVNQGYGPTAAPSAAALQAAIDVCWDRDVQRDQVKAHAAECQVEVNRLLARAGELCLLVRDELAFALRAAPKAQQREVMRGYGLEIKRVVYAGETAVA